MKNNILRHFAFTDLKNHRKESWFMIVMIFIITIISMTTSIITPLLFNQSYIEHLQTVGTWEYTNFDVLSYQQAQQAKVMINNRNISIHDQRFQTCIQSFCGNTLNDESMSSVEGDYEIIAMHLIKGRMPKNSHEIAVKKQVLKNWNYPIRLSQTIGLPYTDHQNHAQVGHFRIVGLIDTAGSDILVKDLPSYESKIYLKGKNEPLNITDSRFESNTSIYEMQISDTSKSYFLALIEFAIMFVTIVLINGITFSSFENRTKDYTLLRSIGATKRQIYYIIFIETLILSLIAMVPAILFVYIGEKLITSFLTLPVPIGLTFADILSNSFIIFIAVIISYFLPAKKALRRSLIGDLFDDEFKYFYYRYKRLHTLKPIYLAWRQLVSVKKKMIVKVILISLMTIYIMANLTDNIKNYTIQSRFQENPDLYFLFEEVPDKKISIERKDFANLKDYDIYFMQYTTDFIDMNARVAMGIADDDESSLFELQGSTIYCYNDDLKKAYQLPDLQVGEVILTSSYANRCQINTDKVVYSNQTFHIKDIILSDTQDMIIMHQDDYQKFGDLHKYQAVMIRFMNHQQINDFLLHRSQEVVHLMNRYTLTRHNAIYPDQIQQSSFANFTIERIVFALVLAVIYLYQFDFELIKQRENIGTYQLLGLTRFEIWSIYFYKSLMIVVIGVIMGTIYHLLDYYYAYKYLTYLSIVFAPTTLLWVFGITFFIFVVLVIISLIPMVSLTKKFGLENKNIRE